jgi:hypothetical protein
MIRITLYISAMVILTCESILGFMDKVFLRQYITTSMHAYVEGGLLMIAIMMAWAPICYAWKPKYKS